MILEFILNEHNNKEQTNQNKKNNETKKGLCYAFSIAWNLLKPKYSKNFIFKCSNIRSDHYHTGENDLMI